MIFNKGLKNSFLDEYFGSVGWYFEYLYCTFVYMRKLQLVILLMVFSYKFSFGQSIAPDWTHADCNSVNHTLYTYLDSQEVVVMEFVMGCSSCTDAGTLLMNLKNEYAISHPGKVNFFLMDYFPSNDCSDVTTTWSSHNFDALFSGCWNEKDFYYPTIYPMPAIIIAAGNYHTVIFNDLSWQNTDTAEIRLAIDQFFNTVGIEDQKTEQSKVYPNPATEVLYFDLSSFNMDELKINVYDVLGKKIPSVGYRIENQRLVLMIAHMLKGNYILELQDAEKTIRKRFIKD
jgi:hypothetical protein